MLDLTTLQPFLEPEHLVWAEGVERFSRDLLTDVVPPADDEAARVQAREILAALGHGGWLKPIERRDLRALALVREALAGASPLADAVVALQALGAGPMLAAAGSGAGNRWLPEIVAGRAMAAFAMTEAEAGSDVASMTTRAVRDGSDYVIDGAKSFVSNAGIADVYVTFASTDASAGARGISCFAVPAEAPGLRFVRPQILSAPHPLGEIAFEACRVPAGARLGVEGGGLKLGLATLDRVRPTVGAAACGMAARALTEAVDHACRREQFGRPLASFQLVQAKLARMVTDLTAARLLVYRAAYAHDQGQGRITYEAAQAKWFATEAAQRIVDDAVQILGGRGVVDDHPVDRLYRAVRALRIYEGTSEIQQLVIARHLLADAGEGS